MLYVPSTSPRSQSLTIATTTPTINAVVRRRTLQDRLCQMAYLHKNDRTECATILTDVQLDTRPHVLSTLYCKIGTADLIVPAVYAEAMAE
jgi:hypothetical protein